MFGYERKYGPWTTALALANHVCFISVFGTALICNVTGMMDEYKEPLVPILVASAFSMLTANLWVRYGARPIHRGGVCSGAAGEPTNWRRVDYK